MQSSGSCEEVHMRLQTLIILVLLYAAGFSSPTHQTSETASNMMMLQPSTALATTDSDPISIINNLGFRDLGLPGAGTKDDPYRIEGLNFQLNASASYTAIQIYYTDAYFAIRDCSISGYIEYNEGWPDVRGGGISLWNTSNGLIERNIFSNFSYGVYMPLNVLFLITTSDPPSM